MAFASVYTNGDTSVGIEGFYSDIDLNLELEDWENREWLRNHIASCFSEIWGEKAYVRFSDEYEG